MMKLLKTLYGFCNILIRIIPKVMRIIKVVIDLAQSIISIKKDTKLSAA